MFPSIHSQKAHSLSHSSFSLPTTPERKEEKKKKVGKQMKRSQYAERSHACNQVNIPPPIPPKDKPPRSNSRSNTHAQIFTVAPNSPVSLALYTPKPHSEADRKGKKREN